MLNEYLVLMKSRGIFYLLFFTTIFLLLGISTCSSHCNTTEDCKNNSSSLFVCCDNICLLTANQCLNGSTNSNSNSSSTNNFTKNFKDSGNMVNTTQVYDTVNLNRSQYAVCSKDDQCNSSNTICVSLECSSKNRDTIEDCGRCESIGCIDGRCYNLTRLVVPTTTATEGTITTLQLVLLFGSMGGIFIFIIIVYCVKTFTDNRRRQYLLKHGVWDNPKDGCSKDKVEDGESKSDSSRQQRKLEVPTITVETETESKKKRKKKKEESKDEITDTDGLEEFAVQQECKRGKDLHVKVIPIADEGNPNANHSDVTNSYSVQPKIDNTIESPKNTRIPAGWDNTSEMTPLTESPKQKRFGNFMKSKENSPTKILANGTPEMSPIFGRHKKSSPPVKLCEPENFSDYGM